MIIVGASCRTLILLFFAINLVWSRVECDLYATRKQHPLHKTSQTTKKSAGFVTPRVTAFW